MGSQVVIFPVLGFTSDAGSFSNTVDQSQLFQFFVQNTATHAQNDQVGFGSYYLTAGTWKAEFAGIGGTDRAIWTLLIAGSSVGTADFYAGVLSYNTSKSITGITIASSGSKSIAIKAATKNASSNNYYMDVGLIVLTRTA